MQETGMEHFKNNVGDWIKGTKARISDLKASANIIRCALEEIKESVTGKSDGCSECENSDKYIQQKLSLIGSCLDQISQGLEMGCVVEKEKLIRLDELVVDFYKEKEAAGKRKKAVARKTAFAGVESTVDERKEREVAKLLHGKDAFLGHSENEKALISRVNEFLVEYLKVVDMACDGNVDEEIVKNDEYGNPSELEGSSNLRDKLDSCLLEYTFDERLDMREVLIASTTFLLRREDMLSLTVNGTLSRKVVDLYVEMLTVEEQELRGKMALFWWIPTYVTRPLEDEHHVVHDRSTWLKWAGNVDDVKKIYLPMKMNDYWFVVVIRVQESVVHVVCSVLEIDVRECLVAVDEVLRCIYAVFMEEIIANKPIGWRFTDFEIFKGHEDVDEDSNGMFVIQLMQASYNNDILSDHGR